MHARAKLSCTVHMYVRAQYIMFHVGTCTYIHKKYTHPKQILKTKINKQQNIKLYSPELIAFE